MKIIIVGRCFKKFKDCSVGVFEFDQAKALAKSGHDVYFLGVDYRSVRHLRPYGVMEEIINEIPVICVSYPVFLLQGELKKKMIKSTMQKAYNLIINHWGIPDIIHAHFFEYAYYVSLILNNFSFPFYITEHSSKMNQDAIKVQDYNMASYAYKKATKIICVSNALSQRISQTIGIEPIVIPNIVDTNIFKYIKFAKRSSKFTFISVANLVPSKRIIDLVQTFICLLEETTNVSLIIIGDGPEKRKIYNLLKKANVLNNIFLTGKKTREEIFDYFKKADCFVLPSASETFGVAYIEALSSGLPVIATKCGGPEGFINDNNGLLIDVGDKKQLLWAMKKMMKTINTYNRSEIASITKRQFSEQTIAKQLISLYEETKRGTKN